MYSEELAKILLKVQKPARYIGGEPGSVLKDKKLCMVRFAFCFPDLYEVGMSHLGMKILYSLYNSLDGVWCERVFAPDVDMEKIMRECRILLYGLESLEPIKQFDFIGFTLQYELSYTTILNMLDLAGLPLRSSDRDDFCPLVIAGGPCACNPEPLAEFIDLFVLGEAEEVSVELIELYRESKAAGCKKTEFLRRAARLEGIYVPSFYDVKYNGDGTVLSITAGNGIPAIVKKRVVNDLDSVFFPKSFVVPFVEIVHDRAMIEVLRGCIRGCRFCQAGFIYRPFREKSASTLSRDGRELCMSTGYDEISLTSLSTSDLSELRALLDDMLDWSTHENINISLPSLRAQNISPRILEQISGVRRSGLTFAPEAGTQRMRDVINKNITEEEIFGACKTAFESGYTSVKLYFMIGLPTETQEDIDGIAELAQRIVDLYYSLPSRQKGKSVSLTISCSCFVPKPFTPFEFEAQDTPATIVAKQQRLKSLIRSKKISIKWHDSNTTLLEAVLARGDRRLSDVIESAWRKGCNLDSWSEHFKYSLWLDAIREHGLDAAFFAHRRRAYDEILPWSHLDYGVSKQFLISENQRAHCAVPTPDCRAQCAGCGIERQGIGSSICRGAFR